MKKLLFGISCALAWSQAIAVGDVTGTVTNILMRAPNIVIFKIGTASTVSGAPSCATSGEWAIASDSTAGKGMYALILSAQSKGQTVRVYGTGLCSVWSDRETPVWIKTID